MFYLHFLALPMFYPLLNDLTAQLHKLNITGSRTELNIPVPFFNTSSAGEIPPPYTLPNLPLRFFSQSEDISLISITETPVNTLLLSLSIPQVYLPLILNTITQLVCVAGVHRLTTRVSALTVTLILVVRKAVSLVISVIGVVRVGETLRDWMYIGIKMLFALCGFGMHTPDGGWSLNGAGVDVDGMLSRFGKVLLGGGTGKSPQEVDKTMMWAGAAMVMLGTVGYTIGSRAKPTKVPKMKSKTD